MKQADLDQIIEAQNNLKAFAEKTWKAVWNELRDAGFSEHELDQRICQQGESVYAIKAQAKNDGYEFS